MWSAEGDEILSKSSVYLGRDGRNEKLAMGDSAREMQVEGKQLYSRQWSLILNRVNINYLNT